MAELDRLFTYYAGMIKTGNPLHTHYARGILDVLTSIKRLHDEMEAQAKSLWQNRQGHGEQSPAMVNRRVMKYWASRLAQLEIVVED